MHNNVTRTVVFYACFGINTLKVSTFQNGKYHGQDINAVRWFFVQKSHGIATTLDGESAP